MQPDESGFFEYVFKLCVGAIFTIGWWLWTRLMNAFADLKEDLTEHKLNVAENYAKRLDLAPIYQTLSDIQSDIKELLGRKREREK